MKTGIERRADGVVVLWLGEGPLEIDTLEIFGAIERLLGFIELDSLPKGVVIASRRSDFLVARAHDYGSAAQAEVACRRAQSALGWLASRPYAVVAAIRGACTGSALDLVLACSQRVAAADEGTCVAHGDVRLGLSTAAGASVRLPRLVGLRRALDLLVAGPRLAPAEAAEIGLVDAIVAPEILIDSAAAMALAGRPRVRRRGALARLGDRLEVERARRGLATSAMAERRIFNGVAAAISAPESVALAREARLFGELAGGSEARCLSQLRDALEEMLARAPAGSNLERLGIIGAGERGSELAAAAAQAGLIVRLVELDAAALARGVRRVGRRLEESVRGGRLTARQAAHAMQRVGGEVGWRGWSGCDVLVVAAPDLPDLEQRLLDEATAACPIVARSSESARQPELVGGRQPLAHLRFSSALADRPLLEVTAAGDVAAGRALTTLAGRLGAVPLMLRAGSGTLVGRLATVLVDEALHLVFGGAPIEAVDEALRHFGFRAGPFELADNIGLSRLEAASRMYAATLGERLPPSPGLEDMLAEGRSGRSAALGFYRWRNGQPLSDPETYEALGVGRGHGPGEDEMVWRCALRLVNEAARCKGEGMLDDCRAIDVAAVLGVGFPGSRGGPLRWADSLGARALFERLRSYQERFGARFMPAAELEQLARGSRRFHDPPVPLAPRRHRRVVAPSATLQRPAVSP